MKPQDLLNVVIVTLIANYAESNMGIFFQLVDKRPICCEFLPKVSPQNIAEYSE